LMTVSRFEIGMLGDEGRNLGFDGLGEQHSRTIAKNFGERIGKASWLNQLGDVILGCEHHSNTRPVKRWPDAAAPERYSATG